MSSQPGDVLPVGGDAAGRLGAAFEDMANEAAHGEAVVVVRSPAEGMDQRTERQRAVGAASGDDDVGAARQSRRRSGMRRDRRSCSTDRPAAAAPENISVEPGRRSSSAIGIRSSPVTTATRSSTPACFSAASTASRQPSGLTPPALTTTRMLLLCKRRRQRPDQRDEIGREAGLRLPGACAREQRHGDLGQIVHDQHIDAAALDQLDGAVLGVAPEAAAAADAKGPAHRPLTCR